MMYRLSRVISLCLLTATLAVVGLAPTSAKAVVVSAERTALSGNGALTLAPGEVKDVLVSFKNSGTTTWKNDGYGYISLYTYAPKYRTSSFDPGTWLSASQVKRIQETTVKPGATATVSFQLHAPTVAGSYTEVFQLASEGLAWVDGGEVKLAITVAKPVIINAPVLGVSPADNGLKATLAMKSANRVKATAGKSILLTAGFTNTGITTWKNYALRTPDVAIAAASASFAHSSWSGSQLVYNDAAPVKSGETGYLSFSFTAPATNGTHTAKFQLVANGTAIDGVFVELPVEVTGGAAEAIHAPSNENAEVVQDANDAIADNLVPEPVIRVGVLIVDEETENEVVITSTESDFSLVDTNGNLLAEIAKGKKVTAYYDGTRYIFDRGNGNEKSTYPIRFVPAVANAVMTITNFDRKVTRGSAFSDNTFRNVLELRYNDTNISHLEFQKALITAARTYAFYHWSRSTKHDAEGFHVDAYLDQVYKGYGQESRTPRLTESIETTRGEIVTYNGETAITSYFSRSDGRTRNWSDVWGGSVPWAKSVAVPCDVGKTLWGHGVGMSASGALCMANDGVLWNDILKHFYTGVELDKRWE